MSVKFKLKFKFKRLRIMIQEGFFFFSMKQDSSTKSKDVRQVDMNRKFKLNCRESSEDTDEDRLE